MIIRRRPTSRLRPGLLLAVAVFTLVSPGTGRGADCPEQILGAWDLEQDFDGSPSGNIVQIGIEAGKVVGTLVAGDVHWRLEGEYSGGIWAGTYRLSGGSLVLTGTFQFTYQANGPGGRDRLDGQFVDTAGSVKYHLSRPHAEVGCPCEGLDLTFPAGRSPKVFTTGWVFGAKAVDGAGDHARLVSWSGTGTFAPNQGTRSVPTFAAEGANTITLSVDLNGQTCRKDFHVDAVSPRGYAATGDRAFAPADAHGCPGDPFAVIGPIETGSPTVSILGKPAARLGDAGIHAACCGPNQFHIQSASPDVLIDGLPAARIGDVTQHCGGIGLITSVASAAGAALRSALQVRPALAPSGKISGRVTDAVGAGIRGVGVTAFGQVNVGAWGTITNENGDYQIDALPADDFAVYFWGGNTAYNAGYVSSWYRDEPSLDAADRVTVAEAGTVAAVDAALSRAGGIAGRVSDRSGNPLANAVVIALGETTGLSWGLAGSDGNYQIAGLPSGRYRVYCRADPEGFVNEWHAHRSAPDAADLVSVTAPDSTVVDFALATGASIAGRVTDADGNPIEGVWVHALEDGGTAGSQATGADGRYRITGLAGRSYVVHFVGESVGLPDEWYPDQPTWDGARMVSVSPGEQTDGIDAQLGQQRCEPADCDDHDSCTADSCTTDGCLHAPSSGIAAVCSACRGGANGAACTGQALPTMVETRFAHACSLEDRIGTSRPKRAKKLKQQVAANLRKVNGLVKKAAKRHKGALPAPCADAIEAVLRGTF